MVAAGYTMYGSSANLILTTGSGVNGYTLDPALGEFILTHPNVSRRGPSPPPALPRLAETDNGALRLPDPDAGPR